MSHTDALDMADYIRQHRYCAAEIGTADGWLVRVYRKTGEHLTDLYTRAEAIGWLVEQNRLTMATA